MLITMKSAIERAMAYEESCPTSPLINTSKGHWNAYSIQEVLANADIQTLLIEYAKDRQLQFSDDLSGNELDRAIDEFLVTRVTELIDNDFQEPKTPGVVFSKDEVDELTANSPELLSSLESTIGQLEVLPYRPVPVREFLPALIKLENLKKPDLDLQYAYNAEVFPVIEEWVTSGKERARLVYMENIDFHIHAQYLDYKLVDGNKPSLLWLDSWHVHEGFGSFRDFTLDLRRLNSDAKDIGLGAIELRNQSVNHGCPIFALNTAKQVYKDPKALDALHQKNANLLPGESRKIKSDAILAPHFMKHTQSPTRMAAYRGSNPEGFTGPVNKKGETLADYNDRHYLYSDYDDAQHMRSIYHKRLDSLLELRTAFGISAN